MSACSACWRLAPPRRKHSGQLWRSALGFRSAQRWRAGCSGSSSEFRGPFRGRETGNPGHLRPSGRTPNLEEISDWLTKILVGVGLIQLGDLVSRAQRLVALVGEGLGSSAAADVMAAGLLAAFTVWGFLVFYLLTRRLMPRVLQDSAIDEITRRAAVEATSAVKEQMNEQAIADAHALTLVDMVLNPQPGNPQPTVEELASALEQASPQVRVTAFSTAARNRRANWREDRPKMALSIPIFQALIECDKKAVFHRNHGQLGYALKDQDPPDWALARAALDEAIRRRGGPRAGYVLYEFNRVLCTVALNQKQPADPQARESVISDLRAIAAVPKLRIYLGGDG